MSSIELQPLPAAALRSYPIQEETSTDVATRFGGRSASPSPDRLSASFDALNPGSRLAPVDGGRDAWTFLAAATMIEVLVWGLPFSVGVLHSHWVTVLFADVPNAEATLTLAATLQTGLMYLSCVVFGPLLNRFPRYRVHMQLVGLTCAVVGLIGSGFATTPSQLLVFLGLIYPVCCVFYLPCAVLLFGWFSEKRGLASGVLYAGTGVGGTVFPFIMSALLKRFSYKTSMIALGVGFGIVGAISLCGIKPRIPVVRSSANAVYRRPRTNWSFLQRSPVYAFLGAILLTSLGNFIPTVWLSTYAQEIGSKPDGATLVASMNAASVPGLLLFGWLSDRLPIRLVITLTAGGAALASVFLWGFAGESSTLLLVFSLAFGLTGLAFTSLWSKLITIVSHDDPALPSQLFGLFAMFRGVGNMASGPIASGLLKSDLFQGGKGSYGLHNFGALLLFSGVMQAAGSICGIAYRDKRTA